jgi:DNA polymerase-1
MTRIIGGKETKKNLLIDGGNIIHRSFYTHVINPRGNEGSRYVTAAGVDYGVLAGVLDHLSSYMSQVGLDHKVSFFFDGFPTRRKSLYPEYKAQRVDRPESQHVLDKNFVLSVLKPMLILLGVDCYYDPNEEADDLCASFCRSHVGERNVIVTDDKDFFPLLVDLRTILYRPSSTDGKFFDREKAESYLSKAIGVEGFKLEHLSVYKSLIGDVSDNIKGIPRLRKKVAFEISRVGSVMEGLYFASKTEQDNIKHSISDIHKNEKLINLITDIDVDRVCEKGSKNISGFKAKAQENGFEGLKISSFLDPIRPAMEDWLSDI